MTKTKLLLTSILAGAVAFGTACKTDKGTAPANTGAEPTVDTSPGGGDNTGVGAPPSSGGSGYEPQPQEGTRETEPGVHQSPPPDEPGTGGTGVEPKPDDRTNSIGGENRGEPLDPEEGTTPDDERTPEPQR